MNNLIQSQKQLKKLALLREEQEKNDRRYMRMALTQARKALARGEVPVGVVIVCDNKVIARDFNKKESKNCAVYHAEINAIISASKKLGWRLENCEMYVTLEPCLMCTGAIVSSRIKRVVFGAYEEKSGYCQSRGNLLNDVGLNHCVNCTGGVLQEECKKLLSDFFETRRKTCVKKDATKTER